MAIASTVSQHTLAKAEGGSAAGSKHQTGFMH